MIQVFSPTLNQNEVIAIAKAMESGWLGKGPKVAEFERAWAAHIGPTPEQVVSTNSCTEALFTAVKLLDIGPGDEVIIPTIHFVGAAQAVLAAGARPVFCDVDSRTLNATLDDIISAKPDYYRWAYNRDIKAVIVNHYGGVSCDIQEIAEWCKGHYIHLIEDAACAPASIYNGKAVGTFGDIGVWSFDAMKILTTGDGGMMYIRDTELADKARKMLYLGTSTDSGLSSDKARWWEFEVELPGARRSVMNDVAAAMGLEQLRKLDNFCYRRATVWDYYDTGLSDLPLDFDLPPRYYSKPSYYFYWIQTPRRDELAAYLKASNIYCTFRYYPLHLAYKTGDSLPNAEKAARETLLLPLHCNLTVDDVSYICVKVREFFNAS